MPLILTDEQQMLAEAADAAKPLYIYPIPATEMLANPNLVQNPGW